METVVALIEIHQLRAVEPLPPSNFGDIYALSGGMSDGVEHERNKVRVVPLRDGNAFNLKTREIYK